nr:RNA-directed DNA polymerase, eukaryota [Tanacetum cinerariifolium]
SGLMKVNLGGSAFTWCHKSASKMSKLDRFLVFESLMNRCPNISAITLERYLSDHRPILLRELNVDYGPSPFRFFHYWIEMEGFCMIVEDDGSGTLLKKTYVMLGNTSFIKILDGPFILNEVLQCCKVKKKQALVFKVDFEKAYDSVRWDFLDEEFQFGKGLKQGDPLAPFLFILILESLHLSFQRVVDAGLFHGLQLGALANLSHMFYADDAVFVGQWSEGNIKSLVHVLETFNLISGLKINMRKSRIIRVHVNRNKVNMAAQQLGCLVLKASFIYLGSMVGGIMSKTNAWNDVVDKVRNRLS